MMGRSCYRYLTTADTDLTYKKKKEQRKRLGKQKLPGTEPIHGVLVLDQFICVFVVFEESEADCSCIQLAVRGKITKKRLRSSCTHSVSRQSVSSSNSTGCFQYFTSQIQEHLNDSYQPQIKSYQCLSRRDLKL